jgi:hypothetical protein
MTAKAAKKREYLRLGANVNELGFKKQGKPTLMTAVVVSRPKARTTKLQQ